MMKKKELLAKIDALKALLSLSFGKEVIVGYCYGEYITITIDKVSECYTINLKWSILDDNLLDTVNFIVDLKRNGLMKKRRVDDCEISVSKLLERYSENTELWIDKATGLLYEQGEDIVCLNDVNKYEKDTDKDIIILYADYGVYTLLPVHGKLELIVNEF